MGDIDTALRTLVREVVREELASALAVLRSAPVVEFVKPEEAAEILRSTRAHARKLARTGKIPSIKDGRRVLMRRADVIAYLEKPATKTEGRSVEELLAPRRASRRAKIKPVPHAPLAVRDVARMLGLGIQRIRQLDAELQPTRTSSGQRIYDLANVERVIAERAAARDANAP